MQNIESDGGKLAAEVVIVGGGPVGMGLAVELGQRGIKTVVVERYHSPQPVPKGQNLTQRTMEHFHFWGIEPELRAARTVPKDHGIGGLTAYGTLLSGYHYDWLQRELVRPYYFTDNERLPQYATETVLRRRAAEIASIDIRYGWSGEAIIQDSAGVTVVAVDRNGGRMSVRASYAVGCDGSNSLVRRAAGIGETRRDHDRRMVLLVFRSPHLHELLSRFPGKAFYNVLHPDFGGYWQFFGRVDLGNTWFFHAPVPADTTQEAFDAAVCLHRAVGEPFDFEIEYAGFWDLRVALADTYRKGCIFIAGDAAHSHPPYGGYGINTGFEDARNLGWKLAARLQHWGGEALLDSYCDERRPVFASTARDFIEKAIEDDRSFLQAHHPDHDLARFEYAWQTRGQNAGAEVDRFEPNYAGSKVISCRLGKISGAVGQHDYAARAGHHLAPLALSSGSNIYDMLGTAFTLIAFSPEPTVVAAFQKEAEKLTIPMRLVVDMADEGRERYAARYILVRPDQFVAWAGEIAPDDAGTVLRQITGLGSDTVT